MKVGVIFSSSPLTFSHFIFLQCMQNRSKVIIHKKYAGEMRFSLEIHFENFFFFTVKWNVTYRKVLLGGLLPPPNQYPKKDMKNVKCLKIINAMITGAYTQNIKNLWKYAKIRNKREHGTARQMLDSYLCECLWRHRYKDKNLFEKILQNISEFTV